MTDTRAQTQLNAGITSFANNSAPSANLDRGYPASEKLEIVRIVEQSHLPAKRTLDHLGIRMTIGRLDVAQSISLPALSSVTKFVPWRS